MTATMSCPPPADLRRTRKVSISSIRRQERQRQRRTSRSRSRSRSRSCSPCCSEGVICCDEGLICCDDAECAAGPLTSPIEVAESASSVASGSCSSATSAGHEASSNEQLSLVSALSEQGDPDCAECQAASDPCTADCFDGPVVAAEDCPECKASPTASNRSLPAINAADVLLDPLECTAVCDLIEWDDNAIDELLRCCCGTGEHQHIFTTPQSGFVSKNSPALPSAPQTPAVCTTDHVHQHSDHLTSVDGIRTPRSFAAALGIPFDNSSLHVGQSFPQVQHGQHELVQQYLPACDADTSLANIRSDVHHTPADLTQSIAPIYSPAQLLHAHAHFHAHQHAHSNLKPVIGDAADSIMVQQSPVGTGYQSPQFRCQWAACSDCFNTREELVGHVNVMHLTALQSSVQTNVFGSFPSSQQYTPCDQHTATSGEYNAAPSNEMNTMLLKCMWDSCDAALPVAPPSSTPQPIQGTSFHDQNQSDLSMQPWNMQNMPVLGPERAPLSCPMSAQPTATLVKHLLQDHLNVSMPLPPAFPLSTGMSPVTGPESHAGTSGFGLHSVAAQHGMDAAHSHSNHSHRHIHHPSSRRSTMSTSSTSSQNATIKTPSDTPVLGASQTLANFGSTTREDEFAFLSTAALGPSTPSLPNLSYSSNVASASGVSSDTASHKCQWENCSMQFPTTAALMDHIGVDHIGSGKSHYLCKWAGCERAQEGRGFNQRQKIVRHVRTHVGDKPCVCEICGRGFSESTTLSQHMRTHTQVKPFECPECGKGFALASALTIHIRTHTGDKPFKCSYPGCDMAFAESSNLSKHLKTHGPAAVREHSLHKKRLSSFDDSERIQKCVRV